MRDHDLRASLAAIGQLQVALEYEGQIIDGRRRAFICADLSIPLQVRVCESLRDACSALWSLNHTERALDLARSEGASSLLELAELCSATPSSVAVAMQSTLAKPSRRKAMRRHVNDLQQHQNRMVRRIVTFEPELLSLAKEKADLIGHKNFAKVVRDAVWRFVRDVPGAPVRQPRRVQSQNGARRRSG